MKISHGILLFMIFVFIFSGCVTTINDAIQNGDLNAVKSIISSDRNKINSRGEYGNSPLHDAAERGELDIVEYLVSQGADVNARDNDGRTPVHDAACGYDIDIVNYLVSQGADVNARDNDDKTPLHDAACRYDIETVKYLVSQGADVNAKDNDDKTPVILAAKYGYTKVANFLSSQMQLTEQKQPEVIGSNETPKKEFSADTTPPKIIISSHDISRGINIVRNQEKVTISGRAIDKSGIAEVILDNKDVNFDKDGNFRADVYLGIGENQIAVIAMDRYENRATKTFTIIREGPEALPKDKIAQTTSGDYYALIIGNNNYKYIRKLETAKKDAQDVMGVLKERYGFKTKLLLDARRNDIVGAINYYRRILKENDSFLIYYAGHGEFDKIASKAYWLPVDARSDDDTNWIIVDTITSNIKRIASRHILIVADSCYSGTFTRRAITDLGSDQETSRYLQKMLTKTSRTLMASGGNEPVSDIGGKGNSVFANAFIASLRSMEQKTFTAEQLFYEHIKERVAGNADQTPEYNVIRNSGHDGGDFVFKLTE